MYIPYDEYNTWEVKQYIKEYCHIEHHNPLDFSLIDMSGPDSPLQGNKTQISGEPDT